jgi:uncharacterized protein YprB with RNaseH-like and TPR domain
MLRNTFLHVPGIGAISEQKLWFSGIHTWEALLQIDPFRLSQRKVQSIRECIGESKRHLDENNPHYFAGLMPSNQLWRLFREFRGSMAYVDIETTGLNSWGNYITTIALYDGRSISHYVHGHNLDEFMEDIGKYRVIITYNGKCFDVPFIESSMGIKMDHAHIDLRYLLKSLGYRGGLKGCEKMLDIDRGDLDGIDGYFAVLLWEDFRRRGNGRALETLLAYNMLDVVNLEALMVIAYNSKLRDTPFFHTHQLPEPLSPHIPFSADRDTIERIKRDIFGYRPGC